MAKITPAGDGGCGPINSPFHTETLHYLCRKGMPIHQCKAAPVCQFILRGMTGGSIQIDHSRVYLVTADVQQETNKEL